MIPAPKRKKPNFKDGFWLHGFCITATDGTKQPFGCRLFRVSNDASLFGVGVGDGSYFSWRSPLRHCDLYFPPGDGIRLEFSRPPKSYSFWVAGRDKRGEFAIKDGGKVYCDASV